MRHPVLSECKDCGNLKHLLNKIECTILYMIRKKHSILIYNLEDNWNEDKYKTLLRYKRIIQRRIYDCTYPCTSIKTSSLIAKATQLAFREGNCSVCETCFPELEDDNS